MSHLRISLTGTDYLAKVITLSSPLTGNMNSLTTRYMSHHFPFRVRQEALILDLLMRDYSELHHFTGLVRQHQLNALYGNSPTVSLFWPERGIQDWTGYIRNVKAGEKAGTTSPVVRIEIQLVDSLTSRRTWVSSSASDFSEIHEGEIPDLPTLDADGKPVDVGGLIPPVAERSKRE